MLKIKSLFNIIIVIFALNLIDAQIQKAISTWIITCGNSYCQNALDTSYMSSCYGSKQCFSIINQHFPVCGICVNQILDVNQHININGVNYLECDKKENLQVKACMFYCRVKYYPIGTCVTHGNTSVCQCLDSTIQTQPTTKTTTTMTIPSTITSTIDESTTISSQLIANATEETTITATSMAVPSTTAIAITETTSSSQPITNNTQATTATTTNIQQPLQYSNLKSILNHHDYVRCLLTLPNGDLASSSLDQAIKIWNVNTTEEKFTLIGHTNDVNKLILLPNGFIASSSSDQTIKIWNPNNGTLVATLIGHTDYISDMIVLKNGYIVSSSWDKTIKIWSNTYDGTLRATLKAHTDHVDTLAVLSNGDLASGSRDKSI